MFKKAQDFWGGALSGRRENVSGIEEPASQGYWEGSSGIRSSIPGRFPHWVLSHLIHLSRNESSCKVGQMCTGK